jgi:integrase
MLSQSPISCMKLAHITTDDAEALRFKHSPANANRALRTLRRMLSKAAEWGVIVAAPRVKLEKEEGRSAIIDAETEFRLLAAASQPLHDVLTIILDSRMRPGEVFQMRWEEIAWDRGMIFIPRGKTKRSRRNIPMTDRVTTTLHVRRDSQTEGWVVPADSGSGHHDGG